MLVGQFVVVLDCCQQVVLWELVYFQQVFDCFVVVVDLWCFFVVGDWQDFQVEIVGEVLVQVQFFVVIEVVFVQVGEIEKVEIYWFFDFVGVGIG